MTTALAGNAGTSIAATATGPAAGEPVTASSVNTMGQSLLDDIATSKKAHRMGRTTLVNALFYVSDGTFGLFSYNVPAGGNAAAVLLEMPDGAVVTAVTVKVAPAVHANLPGTMPKVQFISVTATGTGTTQTFTDTSANVGVYNAAHDITLTLSPSVTIDRSAKVYLMKLVQETGANSVDGDIVSATFTIT